MSAVPPPPAPSPSAAPSSSQPPVSQKSFLVTWLLSLFLGVLGIDRFYLGKIGTGILKLVTFGGLGVWWLIDLIITLTGNARDKEGRVVADYQKYRLVAVIVTAVVILLSIVVGPISAQRGGTQPDSAIDAPPAPAPTETWVQVATLTGNGNARSEVFALTDEKLRIVYTITDDPVLAAIYLEPEEKVDLDAEGAIPAVLPTEAGDGVELVTSKAPGNYWLDVRIPGNWTVSVEQFTTPE
jgi:TM2 domain-containing membrane protein YozV